MVMTSIKVSSQQLVDRSVGRSLGRVVHLNNHKFEELLLWRAIVLHDFIPH